MPERPYTVAPLAPRGLRRPEAARYVGVSETKFDELVASGRMPKPMRVDGCVLWDRWALDGAFSALSDRDDEAPGFAA